MGGADSGQPLLGDTAGLVPKGTRCVSGGLTYRPGEAVGRWPGGCWGALMARWRGWAPSSAPWGRPSHCHLQRGQTPCGTQLLVGTWGEYSPASEQHLEEHGAVPPPCAPKPRAHLARRRSSRNPPGPPPAPGPARGDPVTTGTTVPPLRPSPAQRARRSPPPGPSPAGSPRRCVGSRASTAPGGRAGTGRRGRAPSASAPRAHGSGPGARTPGTAPSGTCGRGRGGDLLLPPPSPCPFTVASPACLAVDAAAVPASPTRAGVAGAAEGPLDALHAAGTQALAPG